MSSVVTEEIRAYIVSEFLHGEDASDLTNDYDLIHGGVIDSLGLVRLLSHLTERYRVPADEIDLGPADLRTLDSITALVETHSPAMSH